MAHDASTASYESSAVTKHRPLNDSDKENTLQPVSALVLLKRKPSRPDLYLLRNGNGKMPPLGLGITEIAATAGCGKTQIGLGLCVSCVHVQNDKSALYLSLGEGSPTKLAQRLQQMAQQYTRQDDGILQRILTKSLRNEDEFMTFIKDDLHSMLDTVGVVVLDSIAGLYRTSQKTYGARSQALFEIAAQLKMYSQHYQVPMVVMNQVTCSLELGKTIPALGLSWASCVNTAYMLERTATTKRKLYLVRSSSLAQMSVSFQIDAGGAVALD